MPGASLPALDAFPPTGAATYCARPQAGFATWLQRRPTTYTAAPPAALALSIGAYHRPHAAVGE